MKIFMTFLFLMGLLQSNSHACDERGTSGIVPENNLWIGADQKNNKISEQEFNKVIDDLSAVYTPIVAGKGGTLQVNRNWDDGTVNAYAQRVGNTWQVSMFGGLARHETITTDGFALVLCHEIGHHIGGAPKKSSWFGLGTWASNEGQADYWGTAKCLRRYFQKDDNITLMENVKIPSIVTKTCSDNFNNETDIAICKRGAMAGLSLGNLFRALRNLTVELKFDTPDPSTVSRTNHNHPEPQCRLDTYYQGAICERDFNLDVDDQDENVGVCSTVNSYNDGVRPLCWFKPENS